MEAVKSACSSFLRPASLMASRAHCRFLAARCPKARRPLPHVIEALVEAGFEGLIDESRSDGLCDEFLKRGNALKGIVERLVIDSWKRLDQPLTEENVALNFWLQGSNSHGGNPLFSNIEPI